MPTASVRTLLILDEIQTGMGRTGAFCAHEHFDIVPDILLLAKALGAGMPLGAFVSRKSILHTFTHHPELGHLTTFGGHPVCCAAAIAGLEILLASDLMTSVPARAALFKTGLQHPVIREVRNAGLLIAVELEAGYSAVDFCKLALERGVITDSFLFDAQSFRIAPPLIITTEEIEAVLKPLLETLDLLRFQGQQRISP